MREFLILKLEGDDPSDAKITAHVLFDGEPTDAIRQGFDGPGRYAILDWDERVEADLDLGPVDVADVQDKTAREQAAEASEEPEPEPEPEPATEPPAEGEPASEEAPA